MCYSLSQNALSSDCLMVCSLPPSFRPGLRRVLEHPPPQPISLLFFTLFYYIFMALSTSWNYIIYLSTSLLPISPTKFSVLWKQWIYVLPMTWTVSGQSRCPIKMCLANEFESWSWGIVQPEYETTDHVDVDIPKAEERKWMERKRNSWWQSPHWKWQNGWAIWSQAKWL